MSAQQDSDNSKGRPSRSNMGPFKPHEISFEQIKDLVVEQQLPICLDVGGQIVCLLTPTHTAACPFCFDPSTVHTCKVNTGISQHWKLHHGVKKGTNFLDMVEKAKDSYQEKQVRYCTIIILRSYITFYHQEVK